MRNDRLKKWEIALALALTITLSCGVPAPTGAYWWGVIFPELTPTACAGTDAPGGGFTLQGEEGEVALRFRLPELLRELWDRLVPPRREAAGTADGQRGQSF